MKLDSFQKTIVSVVFTMLTCSCATIAKNVATPADEAVFVIVRHAEKATDDPKDPALSESGHARAQRLADRLAGEQVLAVYATGYRRTQMTAMPTALAHRLEIRTYDAGATSAEFAAQLRDRHPTGTVLVIGHSNTVPSIASALCGCEVAPLSESEYDRWITIRTDRNGETTLEEKRY